MDVCYNFHINTVLNDQTFHFIFVISNQIITQCTTVRSCTIYRSLKLLLMK